jgi:hypothetical protein
MPSLSRIGSPTATAHRIIADHRPVCAPDHTLCLMIAYVKRSSGPAPGPAAVGLPLSSPDLERPARAVRTIAFIVRPDSRSAVALATNSASDVRPSDGSGRAP